MGIMMMTDEEEGDGVRMAIMMRMRKRGKK